MLRVGVIEDESIIANAICLALKKLNYTPVGPALNFGDACEMIQNERPEILLVDINLNDYKDGVDLAEYVNQNFEIPIIFLSANADEMTIERCKAVHPKSFLVKPFKPQDLYSTIEVVMFNHKVHTNGVAANEMKISRKICNDYLITDREFDVIELIGKGYKQKVVAQTLEISEATVKKHLSNVFEKLEVNSTVEMLIKIKA
jgi:DNA-binding NarL/FixJ family response regulator